MFCVAVIKPWKNARCKNEGIKEQGGVNFALNSGCVRQAE